MPLSTACCGLVVLLWCSDDPTVAGTVLGPGTQSGIVQVEDERATVW